jgi:hypothetical protein
LRAVPASVHINCKNPRTKILGGNKFNKVCLRIRLTSKLQFRPYRYGDEEKITDLLSLVFNGWPHIDTDLTPVEFWKWKYLANPLHPSLVFVGVDGENVISCHHYMVIKVKIMDQIVLGCTALDFAVHPDYRGQRLSSKTSEPNDVKRQEAGIVFSYFITRNPILIKMYASSKNLKFRKPRFPMDLVNLTRISDIDHHFENIPIKNQTIIKAGVKVLKYWNKMWNHPRRTDNLEITHVEYFEEDIDIFIETIQQEHDFMIIRSAKYLNWKYAYPKLGDYRLFIIQEEERIIGYSILRINKYNTAYPVGYIVELITETGRNDAVAKMVSNAISYFDTNNVNIVNVQTVRGHSHVNIYEKYGFLDSRIKINLYTSQADEEVMLEELSTVDPSTIYISWGDHDALPVGLDPHQ